MKKRMNISCKTIHHRSHMQITWASDIHLEFCDSTAQTAFYKKLAENPGEAILLTGDIASHNRTARRLEEMQSATGKQIYFVLGNHDYYGANFRDVTSTCNAQCARNPHIVRLDNSSDPVRVGKSACLIGHEGWGCGTAGLGVETPAQINDAAYIPDLRRFDKPGLFAAMYRMARQSAHHIRALGTRAAAEFQRVLIATHVPPFPENCVYDNQSTAPEYLPYFCNVPLGIALIELAEANPRTRFFVLCGHTHSAARYSPRDNLTVITATAEYRYPTIEALINTELCEF